MASSPRHFTRPRSLAHHSKWPMPLRLHGSVTLKLVVPLLFVAAWSTAITCISFFFYDLGIKDASAWIPGFIVGILLTFRSTTANDRYNEGRKYWAQLNQTSQGLARLIWIHVDERHEKDVVLGKQDLLGKISCLNLVAAFAVALKHKLRFEPSMQYDDLKHLVGHLDAFAKSVEQPKETKQNPFKTAGQFLGLSMAASNPRKLTKDARVPLGNLPLEILSHLCAYLKTLFNNGTFKTGTCQVHSLRALNTMNDILGGTERILNTPLPIAYSIAISQITWVWILLLPFQLYRSMKWVTIPASIFAAYIILGIALIGREIENPFGYDVNDLPLDAFCDQIRQDIDIIMCRVAPVSDDFITHEANILLHPLSQLGSKTWAEKTVEEILTALAVKPSLHYPKADHNKRPKMQPTIRNRKMDDDDDAERGEASAGVGADLGGTESGGDDSD
ncbi:UPF0187-domain-containing protein [Clathrospora elynae]|uniref:UPF0187-domain-containing protein n=1 Tax=Clathrospora elynae TaxID=706981 RepID=A0A6A5S2Y7_9PLEO|nr:UPF0187-domain-containing protein [Clathrospora elynae]